MVYDNDAESGGIALFFWRRRALVPCVVLLSLLTAAGCFPALAADSIPPAPLPLIPMPADVVMGDGRHAITDNTPLHYHDDSGKSVSHYFASLVKRTTGLSLTPRPSTPGVSTTGIDFALDTADTTLPAEGYRLTMEGKRITVHAAQPAGLFYGAVTLWQLITAGGDDHSIPALRIEDAPRFGWRGYMLDSARHFHSVSDIKRMLDAMALHKLNVFHWHLTDDQGWRIQIRKYPRLTEIGGCRIPGGDAGIDAATSQPRTYCGWYTQEQIRDVVAYAAERHITVVPEIDVPGHATAAIAAYPELGVGGTAMPVSNQRGIHANLFNVEEETFAFLSDVLAEVTGLFPGQYVHIGADEAVKTQWQQSPRVQARMRELGIADEAALQSWFVQRLEKMLAARGRRLIGWDEILEGGLPPATTVMSWRGIEGGIEAARQGHDVVMSPVSAMYLDYLQTHSPNEPAGRPKIIPLEAFYNFEPVPETLTAAERRHILGVQANMWTGDTRTFSGVEHNTFPRLAAIAETGWTPASMKNYASFLQRLPEQLHRYQKLGIGYAQTPFEVMADVALMPSPGDSPQGQVQVTLSNPLGYPIRYSLGGGQSDPVWLDYQNPLRLTLPVNLHVAAFANGKALHSVQRLDFTRTSLLERNDEALTLCTMDGPVLRMEDDGPADGPRALFNVAIFEPCWNWSDAPLDGIAAVRVRAGRLPYLIQLGAEDAKRRFLPAESAHGELDIRIDGCEGQRLLTAPLPATPADDGFITVQASLPAPTAGAHDLCIRFSGDTRPAMWVLDRITLLPSKQE